MGWSVAVAVMAGLLLPLQRSAAETISGVSISAAELAAMKAEYKRPQPRAAESKALIDLGRLLFWDPRASASGKTSCKSCHAPELGWAVTDPRSRNDSGKLTSRRSQPLLGVGYMNAPVGWDGRNRSLEAQAKGSIATGSMSMRETDTPVKVEAIEERFRSNPEYVALFRAAMPDAPINLDAMAKAIAAYQRTFEPAVAPFDRWIAGEEAAIPDSAKRGFVLFNRDANCFACHGGWRLTDDKFHDIGTTTTDRGRGRELKDDADMQFAFKTPTLRAVALRPPYMHNGSSPDLYAAVKHYETGGIDRPSRSPLLVPIALSEQERQDLVAFMRTLSGAEGESQPALPAMH